VGASHHGVLIVRTTDLKDLDSARAKLDDQFILSLESKWVDHRDASTKPIHILFEREPNSNSEANTANWESLLELFSNDALSRLTLLGLDAGSRFHSACVSLSVLKRLAARDDIVRIELAQPVKAQRATVFQSTGLPTTKADQFPKSTTKTLMGVIDHGCAFAHQAYRSSSGGTRVLSIWDQHETSLWRDGVGTTPHRAGYGLEINRAEFDLTIRNFSDRGSVDEAACYQHLGYQDMRVEMTHGTHTMGLLAGAWLTPGLQNEFPNDAGYKKLYENDTAAKSDIVFVQLPREILQAPSYGGDHRCIIDGLRYIVACAGDATKHIVVVIDYGSNLGSHDGQSWIERAIDSVIDECQKKGVLLDVVFPSGNSASNASCAQAEMSASNPTSLAMRVPVDIEIPSYAQIWLTRAILNTL
jgi:hypothetical protein